MQLMGGGGGGALNLIPPSLAICSVIVFRRFSSSFPPDSLTGGVDDGVTGDADGKLSVPLVGDGKKGINW